MNDDNSNENLERIDALEQQLYDMMVKHLDQSLTITQMKEVIQSCTIKMLNRLLNEAVVVENYELCQAVKDLIDQKIIKE